MHTKAAAVPAPSEDENAQVELVHAVAVPVQNSATVDVSKRSSAIIMDIKKANAIGDSLVTSATATVIGKSEATKARKQLEEQMYWYPSPRPIEEPKQLLSYYKKLSKFRLTCK